MGTIDITRFISCPAYLFELQGILPLGDNAGVPCRIRMGPRRFVTVPADPDQLRLLACYPTEDGQAVYLPQEPADVTISDTGVLSIDAEALVRKHFGDDYTICDNPNWRWEKHLLHSDVVFTTPYGTATCGRDIADPNRFQSGLYFAPDTLNLCGQNVHYITWSIAEKEYTACGTAFLPLIETALQSRHAPSPKDVLPCLEALNTPQYTRLAIRTDHAEYIVSPASKYLIILPDNGAVSMGYHISDDGSAAALTALLLQLMPHSTEPALQEALLPFIRQGLVTPWE